MVRHNGRPLHGLSLTALLCVECEPHGLAIIIMLLLLPFVQLLSHPLTASVVGDIINMKHGCVASCNMRPNWQERVYEQRAKRVDVGHVAYSACVVALPVQLFNLYDRVKVAGKRHAGHPNFQQLICERYVHRHCRCESAKTSKVGCPDGEGCAMRSNISILR